MKSRTTPTDKYFVEVQTRAEPSDPGRRRVSVPIGQHLEPAFPQRQSPSVPIARHLSAVL
jgi:hypothetical protein